MSGIWELLRFIVGAREYTLPAIGLALFENYPSRLPVVVLSHFPFDGFFRVVSFADARFYP